MKKIQTLFLLLLCVLPLQAQEYATHDAQFGQMSVFLSDSPIDMTKEISEVRLSYTVGSVKCYKGDVVTKLMFKGYNPGRQLTRHVHVKAVNAEAFDVFDGDCTIPSGGSAEEAIVLLELELQKPINVKNDLRFIVESTGEVADTPVFFEGIEKGKPVMMVTVQSEVVYYEGTITDQDGKPLANANVRLYRPNYETGVFDFDFNGSSDAEGRYSVKVEESNCSYNMAVEAASYPSYVVNTFFAVKDGVSMAFGNPAPKDIVLWGRIDFKADTRATICLPEAPDPSWGRYYRLNRIEGSNVIFEREVAPHANVPYVLFPNQNFSVDVSGYDVSKVSKDNLVNNGCKVDEWGFYGTYNNKDFLIGNDRVQIFDCTPDCWDGQAPYPPRIGAFRAYLTATSDAYVKFGTPHYVFVGEAAGIADMTATAPAFPLYDLQGRQLQSQPKKGLYIHNGKKYVVR